ncbi:MAG: hypothetical protein LLG00_09270 [Planctomycetaceae bacterium]|nr:hypothetical protein [Planctomycetaceae bacterium]
MKPWWRDLDRVLRGEATSLDANGEGRLGLPLDRLLLAILLMTMAYGVCMGFYAGFREGGPVVAQWLAVTAKVPCLFFLTLVVTFPSLYVFNALVGSRLTLAAVFELVVGSVAVNVAVLASLGPIVAFFSVSTTSYPFILLLNVLVFLLSGMLGFGFMLRTLGRMIAPRPECIAQQQCDSRHDSLAETECPPEGSEEPSTPVKARLVEEPGSIGGLRGCLLEWRVRTVFACWMMVSTLVCAQMAWVLRPFLGKPSEPFQWFCARESNFFAAVWEAFRTLLM